MGDLTLSLTAVERDRLAEHERTIGRTLGSFVECGQALLAVRDERLYRDTHATIEEYWRERWQLSRAQGYRMIEAAQVVGDLSPIGDTPLPNNEAQARELGRVPAPERADVWQRVVERTEGKPTAAAVRDIAHERVEPAPEPSPDPARPAPIMLTLRTHTGDPVEYKQPQAKATFNQTPSEGISWAEWSWNPVTGCLHGCEYCYARDIANRFTDGFPAGFTPLLHHERLDAPSNTVIPAAHRGDPAWKRVFVCSMADLYGRWVPDEWIKQVHASMLDSPDWEYLLLTKFPARYVGLDLPASAWLGTSVDEQKRVRIAEDAFRQIEGVKVKWLSLEPLREPLEFTDLSMFDWVVIGAQTETRQPDGVVPAFNPPFEWVHRIVGQAKEAGCKVHIKPNLKPVWMLNEYPTEE